MTGITIYTLAVVFTQAFAKLIAGHTMLLRCPMLSDKSVAVVA
jgi:hypothetical protein